MIFVGTITNIATVAVGSLIGVGVGDRLSTETKNLVLAALGLGTILLGVDMALETRSLVLIVGSLALGALIGSALNLEGRIEQFGRWVKKSVRSTSPTFVEGLVDSSILFCVGPLTIIGSLQDGMGDSRMLVMKAILDGFAAMALASALGIGVLFSAAVVGVVQGSLAMLGWALHVDNGARAVVELGAAGGLIVMAIGLSLLRIKKLPLANFLPALAVVVPLTWLVEKFGG